MAKRLRFLLIVVLGWAFIGWLQGTQIYVGIASEGHAPKQPYSRFVLWQVGVWLCWAALTPLVVAVCRRYPLARDWRRILPHALAGVLFALVRSLGAAWVSRVVAPFGPEAYSGPFAQHYVGVLTSYFHLDLLVYWAIVGVVHAVDSQRRLRERELQASRTEAQLANARLANLQLRLQPHFLFNTLHAIAGQVREGERSGAVGMISGLSDLLRYALDNADRAEVSLEEELRVAGQYLDIQRVRFSDRLSVAIEASDEARVAAVPTLLLQPLLENAVQHGVAATSEAVTIHVGARREGQRLVLEVSGDGPPIRGDWRSSDGVGLSSTRHRLETLYGARGTFTLEDRVAGGVVARVTVPYARVGERG